MGEHPIRTPRGRLIRTPRDAEIAARDWMHYFGYDDARLTVIGPDEGVDVVSKRAVAQVKAGESSTGRPVVQQLHGIAALQQKEALLFTVAPVTREAEEWARRSDVALFRLDVAGSIYAENDRARRMLAAAEGRLLGWQAVRAELETLLFETRSAKIQARFKVNRYQGYWHIRHDGRLPILVSRDFAGSGERTVDSVDAAVDLLESNLQELGGSYSDCAPTITLDGITRPFVPRLNYPTLETMVGGARQPLPRITATDVYFARNQPGCQRRFYLEARGEPGREASPLEEMLRRLGADLEARHLASFPDVLDLSEGSLEQREEETNRALRNKHGVIYQGILRTIAVIDGVRCEVLGSPDFLIGVGDGHLIREVKAARRVGEKERPDIAGQLRVYGWLYERTQGQRAIGLEVVGGDGATQEVDPGPPGEIRLALQEVLDLKTAHKDPYCAPKASRSADCPYFQRCWSESVARRDPVVVPGVSRALARWLHEQGVRTIEELSEAYSEARLAEVEILHGKSRRRIGRRAWAILRGAKSLACNRVIRHGPLNLPSAANLVVLDVEGTPTLGSEEGYIYLWGTCVKGESELDYVANFAAVETLEEASGWTIFLDHARTILEVYGPNIPFLHWGIYERVQIDRCIEQHGDPSRIGAKLRENLVDLLAIVRRSVTMPVHSYGLKAVEKFVGFRRSQEEFGGAWSIAMWDEAIGAASPEGREILLNQLAVYNKEDLEGLWAVYCWLRQHA